MKYSVIQYTTQILHPVICRDFFAVRGMEFLIVVDRYSNYKYKYKALSLSSSGVVTVLRSIFMNYGVPERITTDGGTAYTSHETGEFLKDWGVEHHQTSAYQPHSNVQAEGAVRSVKRFVEECLGPGGNLDSDRFAKVMLAYQNTPCSYLGYLQDKFYLLGCYETRCLWTPTS